MRVDIRPMTSVSLVAALAMPLALRAQSMTQFNLGGREIARVDIPGTAIGDFPVGIQQIDGIMEVIDVNGQKMLRASSRASFLLRLPQVLPQDFTLEFEIVPKAGGNPEDLAVEGTPTINQGAGSANVLWHRENLRIIGGGATYDSKVPDSFAASLPGVLTRVVITMQGPTMKLYTNGRLMFTQQRQFVRGRVLRVFLGGQDDGPNAVYLASMRVVDGASAIAAVLSGGPGSAPGSGGGAPAALPGSQNPLPNVGPGGSNTAQNTSGLTGSGTPTPGTTIVQNVTVTMTTQGPLVSWQHGTAPAVYRVQRFKTDDPNCCSNTSPASPALVAPPWQDSPPPISGTYTYQVTATSSSGSAMAGTNFDYIIGTAGGGAVIGGQSAGTRTVTTNTTPTITAPSGAGRTPVNAALTVTVTLGANGPVVTWNAVPLATGYVASRSKSDDLNCCNTASGARTYTATSPWQDQPLPMSGSYTYQVTANTPSGQVTATTQLDYVAPTPLTPLPLSPQSATATPITQPTSTPTPPTRSGGLTPLNTGPASPFVAVNGTPVRAEISWMPPTGSIRHSLRRADKGSTSWTDIATVQIPNVHDYVPDHRRTYTYEVSSFQSDGTFGVATADFTPPAPTDPTGFTATTTGPGQVRFEWNNVQDGDYLLAGPGVPNGVIIPSPGRDPALKVTYTLNSLAAGTHTWTVASSYLGGGVLTPSSAWPKATATVADAAPAQRYRLVALGFEAASQSLDDGNPRDGNGDEVYFAAIVNRTVLTRQPVRVTNGTNISITMSRPHGDEAVSVPYGRIRAGTASATGGIKTGDVVPAGLSMMAPTAAVQTNQFPLMIWEGSLQGDEAVIVHPTLWEDDVDPRGYATWTRRVIDQAVNGYPDPNTAARITELIDGQSIYPGVATYLYGPFMKCDEFLVSFSPCRVDGIDRPMGWRSSGLYDEVMLLTKTTMEGEVRGRFYNAARPPRMPGTFEIALFDSTNPWRANDNARYYLIVRLERVP